MAKEEQKLLKEIEASLAGLVTETKQSKGIFDRYLKGLPIMARASRKLTDVVGDTMKAAFGLQDKALAQGRTLESAMAHNSNIVGGMAGSITGYTEALSNEFGLWSQGLRGNTASLSKLSLWSKITTGSNKQLIAGMVKNTAGLGFNDEQLDRLAQTTMSVGQKYGLTGNQLVKALSKLGNQMKVFAALNVGAEISEAATRLDAKLGPALAGLSSQLIAALTDGGKIVEAALLGVTGERQALLNKEGETYDNASKMLYKAAIANEKQIDRWTRGSIDKAYALKAYSDTFGSHTLELSKWLKGMKEAAGDMPIDEYIAQVDRQNTVNEDFNNTWKNFWNTVVSPIQEAFTVFATWVLKFINLPWVLPLTKALVGLTVVIGAFILFKKLIIGLTGVLNKLFGKSDKDAKSRASLANAMKDLTKAYQKAKGRGKDYFTKKTPGGQSPLGRPGGVRTRFQSMIGQQVRDAKSILKSTWEISKSGFKSLVKGVGFLSKGLIRLPMLLLSGLGKAFLFAFNTVLPAIGSAIATGISMIPVIGWILAALTLLVVFFRKEIWSALKGIWNVLKVVIGGILSGIWTVLKVVWGVIKAVVGFQLKVIGTILGVVWTILEGVWEVLVMVVGAYIKLVWTVLKGVWEVIKAVWTGIVSIVEGIWDVIKWVMNIPAAIGKAIADWWDGKEDEDSEEDKAMQEKGAPKDYASMTAVELAKAFPDDEDLAEDAWEETHGQNRVLDQIRLERAQNVPDTAEYMTAAIKDQENKAAAAEAFGTREQAENFRAVAEALRASSGYQEQQAAATEEANEQRAVQIAQGQQVANNTEPTPSAELAAPGEGVGSPK